MMQSHSGKAQETTRLVRANCGEILRPVAMFALILAFSVWQPISLSAENSFERSAVLSGEDVSGESQQRHPYGRILFREEIPAIPLCSAEAAGLYAPYCGEYDVIVVPMSVSIIAGGKNFPVKELKLHLEFVALDMDDKRKVNIMDIFPDTGAITRDAELTIEVESGLKMLPVVVGSTQTFKIKLPVSSIESGFDDRNAHWLFTERGRIVGAVEVLMLTLIERPVAASMEPYGVVVRSDVTFRRFLGYKNTVSHEVVAQILFPL